MLKSLIAIAAAALVAGLVVFLTAVAPEAEAGTQSATQAAIQAANLAEAASRQPRAKGDRLAVFVKGAACSPRGWPHYEQTCLFDLRRSEVRKVRIIDLNARQMPSAPTDG